MLSGHGESQPLMPNVQDHDRQTRRKYFHFGCFSVSVTAASVFLSFAAVAGQFGQEVFLVLWKNFTRSTSTKLKVDTYFAFSFSYMLLVVIFGLWLCFIKFRMPSKITLTERRFSQVRFFIIGSSGATSVVLFVVSEEKTPWNLQEIFACSMIPLTFLLRYLMLRKTPSLLKVISGGLVFGMFFVNFGYQFYKKSMDEGQEYQKSYERVLWPLCFLLAFFPAAFMNVVEEESLKKENLSEIGCRRVNLIYFLFWTALYQLLVIIILFWVDIVPGFGDYSGFQSDFWKSWRDDITGLFGDRSFCTAQCRLYGFLFVLVSLISFISNALLLRYTEGATYLAILLSLSTPLVSLLWSLLSLGADSDLQGQTPTTATWLSLASTAGMLVFIFIYNIGPPDRPRSAYQVREVYEEYVPDQIPSLHDPIRDLYKSL